MNFYTYKAPGTTVESLRTQEVYDGYAESGMTAVYITGRNSYCIDGEEPWEGSVAQQCFKLARNAGIKRVILRDDRLYEQLISLKEGLLGANGRFKDRDELDGYVYGCMKDYVKEEGFYGLGLLDEPSVSHVFSYGEVYRSIKRTAKKFGIENIYIQMNLNPMIRDAYFLMADDYINYTEDRLYERYLDAFLSATGADLISVDNYPFRPSYEGGRFLNGYYICFQILKKKCAEYGARLAFVLQSFEMIHKTNPKATAGFRRVSSVNEMFLQMNGVLGFGIRDISFYTYENEFVGANFPYRTQDGCAFITTTGEKTRIYYFAKAAIAHAKALEPVLFKFDYAGARLSVHESASFCADNYLKSEGMVTKDGVVTEPSARFDNSHEFKFIENFAHDRDVLLITELKIEAGARLYMAQNVIDTPYKRDLAPMTVTLAFDPRVKRVRYYTDGWHETKIAGRFEAKLALGEAVFVLPYEN